MRILVIGAMLLVLAAPAFAGDATPEEQPQSQIQSQPQSKPQQNPAVDMQKLLRELRELDSSQDEEGDHVVGEHLC